MSLRAPHGNSARKEENEKRPHGGKPVFLGTGPFLYFPGPLLYFYLYIEINVRNRVRVSCSDPYQHIFVLTRVLHLFTISSGLEANQHFMAPPYFLLIKVQFSSVQLLSHVRLFVTPWIAAHQASLSITNSQSPLRLTSIESVMPSSHLILGRPLLLLPPISPSIKVFSNESTLHINSPLIIAKAKKY